MTDTIEVGDKVTVTVESTIPDNPAEIIKGVITWVPGGPRDFYQIKTQQGVVVLGQFLWIFRANTGSDRLSLVETETDK